MLKKKGNDGVNTKFIAIDHSLALAKKLGLLCPNGTLSFRPMRNCVASRWELDNQRACYRQWLIIGFDIRFGVYEDSRQDISAR